MASGEDTVLQITMVYPLTKMAAEACQKGVFHPGQLQRALNSHETFHISVALVQPDGSIAAKPAQ